MSFFNLLCGLILEGFKSTVETQLTTGGWTAMLHTNRVICSSMSACPASCHVVTAVMSLILEGFKATEGMQLTKGHRAKPLAAFACCKQGPGSARLAWLMCSTDSAAAVVLRAPVQRLDGPAS